MLHYESFFHVCLQLINVFISNFLQIQLRIRPESGTYWLSAFGMCPISATAEVIVSLQKKNTTKQALRVFIFSDVAEKQQQKLYPDIYSTYRRTDYRCQVEN